MGSSFGSSFGSHAVDFPHPNATTPVTPGTLPQKRAYAISAKETLVLQAWLQGADAMTACQAGGYAPKSVDAASSMVHQMLGKIDREANAHDTFIACGLGMTQWMKTLKRVIDDDNPKFLVVALKLWGVALGIFNEQQTTQGAQITVNVLGSDTHTRARETQMVQINVDGQTIEMPHVEHESGDGQ